MAALSKTLILVMSIAVAWGADKDQPFRAGPAAGYPTKVTAEKITIAAVPYFEEEMEKSAFGKVRPNRHGMLPVLVVIQNGTGKLLAVDGMKAEYVAPDRSRVRPTPVEDLAYTTGPGRPDYAGGGPLPRQGPRIKGKKSPLGDALMSVRAFSARVIQPGEEASGFLYFETGHRRGSQLYLTGLRDAGSGKEYFYFEIPLDE